MAYKIDDYPVDVKPPQLPKEKMLSEVSGMPPEEDKKMDYKTLEELNDQRPITSGSPRIPDEPPIQLMDEGLKDPDIIIMKS